MLGATCRIRENCNGDGYELHGVEAGVFMFIIFERTVIFKVAGDLMNKVSRVCFQVKLKGANFP